MIIRKDIAMDWRQSGMRPFIDRRRGCRYCLTSSGLKKMHDTESRVSQKQQDLWSSRKKRHQE